MGILHLHMTLVDWNNMLPFYQGCWKIGEHTGNITGWEKCLMVRDLKSLVSSAYQKVDCVII